jgi:hypothetical protein
MQRVLSRNFVRLHDAGRGGRKAVGAPRWAGGGGGGGGAGVGRGAPGRGGGGGTGGPAARGGGGEGARRHGLGGGVEEGAAGVWWALLPLPFAASPLQAARQALQEDPHRHLSRGAGFASSLSSARPFMSVISPIILLARHQLHFRGILPVTSWHFYEHLH